jgi:adenine deaminase
MQIASLNAAAYFGLKDLGAIAPGYRADIAVLDDLESLNVMKVFKDGKLVAEDGHLIVSLDSTPAPKGTTMRTGLLDVGSFRIRSDGSRSGPFPARVIGIVPDQIITKSLAIQPKIAKGLVVADLDSDVLKMAVVERHMATGNVGLGLVKGFGLQAGAIATSVAHDSHNIVVVGVTDEEMLDAVLRVIEMGGGLAVVKDGRIKASLPLPVAGLLSEMYMHDVAEGIDDCIDAVHDLGCQLKDPFMTLSFLCLPVIPELKLTDKGLVDVAKFQLVPLFMENA